MTILFASSEDIDLPLTLGIWAHTTNVLHRDENYSRYTIRIGGPGATSNRFETVPFSPQNTTTWFSTLVYFEATTGNNADGDVIQLLNNGTSVALMDVTNGSWQSKINNGGFVQVGSSFSLTAASLQKITIQFVIDATNGIFRVWQGGVLKTEFIGDTTGTHGQTVIDTIRFQETHPSSNAAYAYYSEVIVADEPTHNMRVSSLVPDADGNDTAWAGDWSDVDEITIDEGDVLTSSAADEVEIMNVLPYLGDTGLKVRSVFVSAFAKKSVISSILLEDDAGLLQLEDGLGNLLLEDGSGPEIIQVGVRHGATSAFSDNLSLAEDSLYSTVGAQFTINPDTGIAWTIADLAALQAGVKSIA